MASVNNSNSIDLALSASFTQDTQIYFNLKIVVFKVKSEVFVVGVMHRSFIENLIAVVLQQSEASQAPYNDFLSRCSSPSSS